MSSGDLFGTRRESGPAGSLVYPSRSLTRPRTPTPADRPGPLPLSVPDRTPTPADRPGPLPLSVPDRTPTPAARPGPLGPQHTAARLGRTLTPAYRPTRASTPGSWPDLHALAVCALCMRSVYALCCMRSVYALCVCGGMRTCEHPTAYSHRIRLPHTATAYSHRIQHRGREFGDRPSPSPWARPLEPRDHVSPPLTTLRLPVSCQPP